MMSDSREPSLANGVHSDHEYYISDISDVVVANTGVCFFMLLFDLEMTESSIGKQASKPFINLIFQ